MGALLMSKNHILGTGQHHNHTQVAYDVYGVIRQGADIVCKAAAQKCYMRGRYRNRHCKGMLDDQGQ